MATVERGKSSMGGGKLEVGAKRVCRCVGVGVYVCMYVRM